MTNPPKLAKTRIVCISDTHNQTPALPKGDVLIHAGDLTNQGTYSEMKKCVEWIEKSDFEVKVVVGGMFFFFIPSRKFGGELSGRRKPKGFEG
jgi:hypothetical protein